MKKRTGSPTAPLPQFGRDLRRDVGSQPLRPFVGLPELVLEFLNVVEVIGKGGVDVRQRDPGEEVDDLVGAISAFLMPGDDIQDADPMPGDAGPASANLGGLCDVVTDDPAHDASLPGRRTTLDISRL